MRWNEADWSCKSRLKLVEVITAGFYKIFFLFLRSLVSFQRQCWRVGPTASPWWWRCLCAWLGMIFMWASSMFPPNSRAVQAFVGTVVSLLPGLVHCRLTAHRAVLMITSMGTVKANGETAIFSTLCCGLLLLHTAACPGKRPCRGYRIIFGLPIGEKNSRLKMLPWAILWYFKNQRWKEISKLVD